MPADEPGSTDKPGERLSLIIGGPFHEFLRRAGLLGPDLLPAFRAGAVLAAVAWIPSAALAILQALVAGEPQALAFFSDPSAIARFIVGVFTLVAVERQADVRIRLVIDNFRSARLVDDRNLPELTAALATADRRTSSRVAEAVMLAVAVVTPGFIFDYGVSIDPSAWEGRAVNGEAVLSWAGMAARYVSAPLFEFLLLRWLWRFVAMTHLLFRLSRIELRLSILHPDRMGGLSFVSLYPPVFNGLVFAVSSGIAASFIRDLGVESVSLQTVQILVAAWVLIAVALMIGPLLVFTPCLMALKENAILHYGRLAGELHQAFESKWLATHATGADLLASPDASAAADTNAIVGAIWALRVIPVDMATVLSVALAAGIPMLAVLATQMPLDELAKYLLGVVM